MYILTDSWYTNNALANECLISGYHLIGAVKPNMKISSKGVSLKLSEFKEYIDPNTLYVVTIKGKDYKIYSYEGSVSKIENASLLICYEVDGENLKKPI